MYKGPILQTMKQRRGEKRRYTVLEDNDPSGYKSKKALAAKAECGVVTINLPRYSPDLNPLDYFLWEEVEQRMARNAPKGPETVVSFKRRLRRTALAIPEAVIRKGIADMKGRIGNCFKHRGKHITWD